VTRTAREGSPWLALDQVLAATGGRLLAGSPKDGTRFTACAIDSRTLAGGELFVPLPGSRADGHDFVTLALEGGAGGSLVRVGHSQEERWRSSGKPILEVEDPLAALQAIGRHCRDRASIPTVAVTGSNGKTTTKEMIAAVLGVRRRVHKNVGNLNNHIGVPLTLTHLRPEHEALVLELGMSARGEITFLASLCRPLVGVLTNASAAHLAQLGTVDEVALAKSELAEAILQDGLLVLNADDPRLWALNRERPTTVRSYGLESPEADLRPIALEVSAEGGTRFRLSDGTEVALALLGKHNARNALAAILVGDWLGVPREESARALSELRPARRRLEILRSPSGVTVLDDSYNANPASMREALALLGSIEARGERRAVLGDMLELGSETGLLHEEVGLHVPRSAWLYVAGEQAGSTERGALAAGLPASKIRRFEDVPTMAEAVARDAKPGDLVLVKASRGMRLERVVERLVPAPAAPSSRPSGSGIGTSMSAARR
jgi:UDP-N-acetylmuramoyl-tripeptide--D-alanyl-D-alanine ligase